MFTRQIKPVVLDGSVARIPLTRGYEAIIDAKDVGLVEEFCWSASYGRCRIPRAITNMEAGRGRRTVLLHRWLMQAESSQVVDHRDGNSLNNRRGNLRLCTQRNNAWNSKARGDNSSGFKGVTVDHSKGRPRYRAHIGFRAGRKSLGSYRCPIEAARAYDAAAREIYGELACTNFPIGSERSDLEVMVP